MAIEEEQECECGEERVEWIYTYGDMVTLLLAFFILLFAMSKTEENLFKAISASFKGGPPASPFVFSGLPTFMENIEAALKKSDISEVTDITVDDRGITVSFSDTVMFAPGSATPTQLGNDVIEKFSRILHAISNRVIVEGHTDNTPIRTPIFPSNWELSGARSGSVARLLESFGVKSKRIEIAGYGSTRPKVPNDSSELKSLNRRIDILVKPDGF
ncbi:MAG: flagellar motor protein MotB [Deltaproteobacteria bacterium]|nr:flagellar motor protein MotB [Deltaproteobacteria bacterium]